MIAIALFTPAGIAAALYYIVHSTLAAAALFLIVDLTRAGRAHLDLTAAPPIAGASLTAGLFFAAAIAMTGLPPLSGFIGKLLILDAAYNSSLMVWTWAVILCSSLVSVVGFGRAGSTVYWKAKSVAPDPEAEPAQPPAPLAYFAVGGLVTLLALHTVFAGQMHAYTTTMAQQLFAPEAYMQTVLDTPGKLSTPKEGY